MSDNSRWDLANAQVGRYVETSFDFVVDMLCRMDASVPYSLDPAGDEALRSAKRVRREALRLGVDEASDAAENHFGIPATGLNYSESLEVPAYPPILSESI
jgi:hypothetical protein